MSLEVMTKLHEEYHVASMSLQMKKAETGKKSEATSGEEAHLKLEKLEKLITRCSFGLEHIIRELAQLYQLPDISTNDYPGAAAEILLSGHPLELVDGDSCYIPLRWFDAVYTKLEEKTNNAQIFVISVLGIQSSGKSTLLNTMFGLEFPVSAGRCTRGAFASLIPVSDSLKNASNFDYVLIVDTEGLRGSVNPQVREHDNELATFAIGIANVTIVNIFGESHNEMKEFLEIAVAAFLKMKLVKEKKTFKIVHQNVGATDATIKLAVDRVKLKKDLDKMAKVAATQEHCEDLFEKLNDIISFDENKDVFYIPTLLEGSPPMAPVNPKYGRAAQKVKDDIISLMLKSSSQSSISQFRERVSNLWRAMLKENFIFSFRNTIEVRAHTSLDRKYYEESVNLLVMGMSNVERKIQVALSKSTNRDEREAVWECSQKQIQEEAKAIGEKMEEAMENFFQTNEDKETLEQWREHVMNKIVRQKENQVAEVTRNCLRTFNYWQNRQEVDKKKQNCEMVLLEKAREFITSRQDVKNCCQFEKEFEQQWEKWIKDVPHFEERKVNVNEEMILVLSANTDPLLNRDMTEKLDQQGRSITKFEELIPDIDSDQLRIPCVKHKGDFFISQQLISAAKIIRDQAFECGIDFAKKISKSGCRCRHNDLTEMYHKVITYIQKESKDHCFEFRKSITCDILLHTFARAYEIFDKMEERYFQERDIRGELERNLRPRLERYFLNLCDQMEKDVLTANSIVDALQQPIESEMNHAMGPAVAREVLKNSEFQSKGKFHASVLIQLGEEGKFELYIPYLENPVRFLKKKMIESIETFCLKNPKTNENSLLKKEAEKIEDEVFAAISVANTKVTQSGNKTVTFWIQEFVQNCSTLEITKEMFAVAAIDDKLQDISVFDGKVRERVAQFIQSLIKQGINRTVMEKWDPSPHDHLFSSMFGCQSCCPFCKSLCDQTVHNHAGSHSTRIHRPTGLNSYRNTETGILSDYICTNRVAGEVTFRNAETSREPHPYKDYKSVNKYYATWSIPPDSSFEALNYWQWFMATFSKQLAEHYQAKEPEIPLAWKLLSLRDVKEQLRQDYKL